MPANLPNRPPQILSPAPFESLTGLRLQVAVAEMSAVLAGAAAIDRVQVNTGAENLMELEFGGGRFGERHDLRPELPLVVCW